MHKSRESLSPLTVRVDWSRGKRRAMGREEQMNIGVNLLDNSLVLELCSIKMAPRILLSGVRTQRGENFEPFTGETLNEI